MVVTRIVAAGALIAALGTTDAAAQPLRDRFWVAVNGGGQVPAEGFSDRFQFERFVETATVNTDYDADPGALFDGGFGFRFFQRLGAGVAVSRFQRDAVADIDASIPHPFFDNRFRDVAGSIDNAARTETAVHVQVTYTIDRRGPLRLVLAAGPSFFTIEQDVVTGVQYAEAFPFDEATFAGAEKTGGSESATGFHAGADVIWLVGRAWGVGAMVRYARASVDIAVRAPSPRSVAVKAGGLQAGGGIRILF